MKTSSVKGYAREKGISYYKIAKYTGQSEIGVYRSLRDAEIDDEKAREYFSVIDAIAEKEALEAERNK